MTRVLILFGLLLAMRPGGGESYSGGSSSSSGSSYSGGGSSSSSDYSSGGGSSYSGGGEMSGEGLVVALLVIVAFVVISVIIQAVKQQPDWDSGAVGMGGTFASSREPARRTLERLAIEKDADFSIAPFEDFLHALYQRAQEARGNGTLASLGTWLSEPARAAMAAQPAGAVKNVIVGRLGWLDAKRTLDGMLHATAELEANYSEGDTAWYVKEIWRLERGANARSRPPDQARVFVCPNCAAPLAALRDDTCAHCGKPVTTGELDWRVAEIRVAEKQARGPQLLGDTAEQGNELPTVVDQEAPERLRALGERDAGFTWPTFEQRVRLIFHELQQAWSSQQLVRARAFLSDNLFATQQYWIEAYKAAGLRNITDQAQVTAVELAAVSSDRWYDSVTVRLFASSLDYSVDGDGRVRAGSKSTPRAYTEYWTLIRGVTRRGAARTTAVCPNCAAALDKVNMAGVCEYCQARVTTGDFDWVLSRIEQDDSYRG